MSLSRPHRRVAGLALGPAWLVAACCLALWPAPARGLDYDRNDVLGRELALGAMVAPFDLDPAGPVCVTGGSLDACPASRVDAHVVRPLGMFVRGTARRHTRYLYFAAELQLGATLPTSGYGMHPWLAAGGAVGGETADDAWQPLRGYGELGLLATYAHTRLADTLNFFTEAGLRYQARLHSRPHVQLHIGARALHNLQRLGFALQAGIGWTFD